MAEAQSFELLKIKRKSLRTAVTKVVNELEAELSNSDLNVDTLCELVEILCIKFEPLTLIDQQMEPLFKPEEFDGEFEIAEKYREKVLLWQFRAKKKINDFSKPHVTSPSLQTTLSQSQDEHFRNSDNIRIKVPKYITRFYGDDTSKCLFLLAAVLNHHFKQALEHFEKAAEKLIDSMFVDNCVASVDSSEELESFQRDSTELLALGKFDLYGWRHSDIESNFDFQDNQQKSDPEEILVLRLMWNVKEDTFSISYRETESKEVTKRRILSLAHRYFDPIGFTCPITLVTELLIEECWKIETSWNSKLQIDIERKFERWKNQLTEIQDLKIPWRLSSLDFKDMNLSLQVFCDASKSSYARQNFRLPIILPSNHQVVKAHIIYKHVQLGHAGVQMLMYTLRESYWILKGRKTIKEVIKTCIICKRFNAKLISVSEGLLHQDRVRDAAVFEIIGLDLAGSLILKNGEKNWILILTCTVYRAIHLEWLTSVSTESFLLGLRRFIARRGRPNVIYSEFGTNFKGAY
ncbi:integrase catalytic domain-containing protein [Trichonephila clavipes]|nr:integrase catalytic domain-containing protein [Trichonephila clavipes]